MAVDSHLGEAPVAFWVQDKMPADAAPRRRSWMLAVCAGAVPAAAYAFFVLHYARNGIYWDDWSFVPIVDQWVHHRGHLSTFWAQHNENRLLVPYLIVAIMGSLTHLNTLYIIYLGVALYIGSFALFLACATSYLERRLRPMWILIMACIWFSVADVENELWAFQIAWYLVLLGFMAMLYFLSRSTLTVPLLVLAAVTAVVASCSSLQGLLLWPIGLLCIYWRIRGQNRRRAVVCVSWVLVALGTTSLYAYHLDLSSGATGGGSSSFAYQHPFLTVKFVLALLGNVLWTNSSSYNVHVIIGLIVTLAALFTVLQGIRTCRSRPAIPLPLALIIFGVLFDVSVAIGRVSKGSSVALSSRYLMGNLLVVLAVACASFAGQGSRAAHISRKRLRARKMWLEAVLVLFVFSQVVSGTLAGVEAAGSWRSTVEAGDRIAVDLEARPLTSTQEQIFDTTVYPSLPALAASGWIGAAVRDGLGEFSRQGRQAGSLNTAGVADAAKAASG